MIVRVRAEDYRDPRGMEIERFIQYHSLQHLTQLAICSQLNKNVVWLQLMPCYSERNKIIY
jgi:hypothetical protein